MTPHKKQEMKIGDKINILILEGESEMTRYQGLVESKIEEDVPALNIKKGDYWILVDKLGKRLVAKDNCLFNFKSKPLLIFDNRSIWVPLK